ncbi:hypothetical protein L6452_35493 [Arctium lappa]|uniref:Uncharacterized protein n=1 Tax=Arctium lappa TaxID=4217 RepID=A0ACB8Y6P6_ARCLA|nr:hypothetical protein L6452_35493 [Arctium lappa]
MKQYTMTIDKSWTTCRHRNSEEFWNSLQAFIEIAKRHVNSDGKVRCPCKKCLNFTRVKVTIALLGADIDALFDLENTHQELKSDLKDLYINSSKEDEMQQYLEIHRQHLKFHRHDAIILLRIQQTSFQVQIGTRPGQVSRSKGKRAYFQSLPQIRSGSSLQVLVHSLPQIAAAGTAAAETAAAGTTT